MDLSLCFKYVVKYTSKGTSYEGCRYRVRLGSSTYTKMAGEKEVLTEVSFIQIP